MAPDLTIFLLQRQNMDVIEYQTIEYKQIVKGEK